MLFIECFYLILLQNGNITELLLKEGFARCVDWSMAVYTQGAEKLRAAERYVTVGTSNALLSTGNISGIWKSSVF